MVAVETSGLIECVFRVMSMPAVLQFFPGLCPVSVLGNGPVNGPGGRVRIITSWGGEGRGWLGGVVGSLLGGVGSARGVGGGGGGGCVVVMVVEGRVVVALALVWADCWMSWGSCCKNWVMETIWAPSACRGVVTSPMAVLSLSFRDVSVAVCLS